MAEVVYSWHDTHGKSTYRLPGPENFGWWVAVAVLLALLVHVGLFFMLGRITVAFGFGEALEIRTAPVNVEQVEVRPAEWEEAAPPDEVEQPREEAVPLLEEIDMLELLPKDIEIEIRPDITEADYELKLENPALSGELEGESIEPVAGPAIEAEIAELGRLDAVLEPVPEGRVIVDPGAASSDVLDPDAFNEELLKKGAEGASDRGVLKDFTSLDEMIGMTGNSLLDKKAMIGSDLLFDYDSDVLRESARLSLMKVAMLVDRNPDLFCWIEGHTDLYGGDDFNLDLSRRRAAAVKAYLTGSLQLAADKLVVRGFGKGRPIVPGGSIQEQALNRRVEIKMRKEQGADEPVVVRPKRAIPVPDAPPAQPPAATPEPKPPEPTPPPRAQPVEEPPPPRAQPVQEPPPPRAQPVEEPPPRALPVEEEAPPAAPAQ